MSYNVVASNGNITLAQQPQKKKVEWPEALKLYVGRAFENIGDGDRVALEIHLKDKINFAFETRSVWSTNWDVEPLPVLSQPPRQYTQLLPESRATKAVESSDDMSVPSKRKKSRFDVPKSALSGAINDSEALKAKRARRFEDLASKKSAPVPPEATLVTATGFSEGVPDFDEYTIVGHATKLEKSYLRLTSAPDPGTVRPLHVLKDTLELLKKKWKENANYAYICDQFKSMRQDLTVQRIKNDFTINVYEIHARIALEKSDLGEYNQCQTQLQTLYSQLPSTGHPLEFLAYRILYMLHTRNLADINTVLINLTPTLRADPSISHALSVRKALACNNYPRLFRLYLNAPNMSGYLMDNFVDRERISALSVMCRACRPTLDLDNHLAASLGFTEVNELHDFLIGLGDEDLLNSIKNSPSETISNNNRNTQEFKEFLDTKKAAEVFERKKNAMGGVDIKGQI